MSEPYTMLLDAAIAHLETLKNEGTRFVGVPPESLKVLNENAPQKPTPSSRPSLASAVSQTIAKTEPRKIFSAAAPEAAPVAAAKAGLAVPAVPLSKAEAIDALRKRVSACLKCPKLVAARKNVVFGVGDINARLMFVGEAPGADEDIQGEPFVGAAGQLLTRIITAMGLSRDTVYIANILKCRPDMPPQTSGNRKPTTQEMHTCLPYLREQIDLIKPEVLVALGATAVEGLLGKTEGISKLRGHWREFAGIPVMPTYHPAYLLRNQSITEKRKVWEDMLLAMEKLQMPISDKQRGFFLAAK